MRELPIFTERLIRRDKIQILADILAVCVEPVRRTKIIRMANVQYAILMPCLDNLMRAGFLEIVYKRPDLRGRRDLHKSTPTGLAWAQKVHELYEVFQESS